MSKEKEEKEYIELDAGEDEIILVAEAIKISDGAHSGVISKVVREARGDEGQFVYLDCYVTTKDDDNANVDIKMGFPFYLSEGSGLGKLLTKAGLKFKGGDKIKKSQIYATLKGRKLIFQTFTEETKKGTFSRIMEQTVKFE